MPLVCIVGLGLVIWFGGSAGAVIELWGYWLGLLWWGKFGGGWVCF